MYIDFEKYGIDNFNFEILEECPLEKLDDREIAYIKEYDTYYNGYNLTVGGQKGSFKKRPLLKKIIEDYKLDKKITSKQWQVYYYLLSISYYDSQNIENHRYVYKKDFSVSAAAKFLGISRPTIYTALSNLKEIGLVREREEVYLLYARNWTKINKETLKDLLCFSQKTSKRIDILRIYLILKKIDELAKESKDKCFTKKDLITFLGHNITTSSDYEDMTGYLALLTYFNFIELKSHTDYKEGLGKFIVYHIQKINEVTDKKDELKCIMSGIDGSATPDYIKEVLKDI